MFSFLSKQLSICSLVLGCVSCTVYAPMQPTMPLVRNPGETEFSASFQPSGRAEVTAAFSPARGAVFTGGVTGSAKLGQQHYLLTRQYEVGGGLYRPLGNHWLMSGLAGFGSANTDRTYTEVSIIGSGPVRDYQSSYHKYFGQLGFAHVQPEDTYGLTYRLTQVHFDRLTEASVGTLPLQNMLRHELLVFVRSPLAHSEKWHMQVAMGLSISSTGRLTDNFAYSSYNSAVDRANAILTPAFLASVGVGYALPGHR